MRVPYDALPARSSDTVADRFHFTRVGPHVGSTDATIFSESSDYGHAHVLSTDFLIIIIIICALRLVDVRVDHARARATVLTASPFLGLLRLGM